VAVSISSPGRTLTRGRSGLALILVGLVGCVSAPDVHAGRGVWTTAGPEGGVIRSLAIEPGIGGAGVVYSGTPSSGVFKSSTGGNFWTPIGLDSQGAIQALVMDPRTPTTLYVGTSFGLIFKSTNGGASWAGAVRLFDLGQLEDVDILTLTIDPQTPTTLYAGTAVSSEQPRGPVFKSTDGGATWRSSSVGLRPDRFISALAIDPKIPTTLYAGSVEGGGVFRSIDGGATWTDSSSGLPGDGIDSLAVDPQTPSIVYAGAGGGVFKTSNGGATWAPSHVGLAPGRGIRIAIDPQTPAVLYAGTAAAGVFKSTNGGTSWIAASAGLLDRRIYALAVDPRTPAVVYAGTFGRGVFKSTNGGATWAGSPNALTAQAINVQAIDPRTPSIVYAGTYGGGVFKSTNGGASWSVSSAGLTADVVYALAVDPRTPATVYGAGATTAFSGTSSFFFNGIVLSKSLDGGASWQPSATGITGFVVYALAIDPQRPATLYAGTERRVFKSTDAGASWSAADVGLPSQEVVTLAIDPQTPDVVYAGTSAGVFKSTNGGGSWSARNSGLPINFSLPPPVVALAIVPEAPTVVYAATDVFGVFKSTDGGATWNDTNLTYRRPTTVAVVPRTPGTVYAGTFGGGMFKSTNGGATWAPENSGFKNLDVLSLAVDPSGACLHAGTATGAFSFATRVDSACLPPPPLVAVLSTTSHSVEVGATARVFATVENPSGTSGGGADVPVDGAAGVACGITQLTGALTPFSFQAVDETTNHPVAPVNTPVDIGHASRQKFSITLTPSAPVCPTDIQFGFHCTNSGLADIISGTNTLLLRAGSPAGCGLGASVSASQARFVVGQTLIASGSVTNPGLPGVAADFYVGLLRPDGSIQFITPAGLVVGSVSDLRSFRPLAENVPMAAPFSTSQSSLLTHRWTVDDLRGSYVFFVLSVKAGALAGGTIVGDQILKLATAPFTFP
jgi:photosystem II stability/assembly factor-like uncharacterized protein